MNPLDRTVRTALDELRADGAPAPAALLWLAVGADGLLELLEGPRSSTSPTAGLEIHAAALGREPGGPMVWIVEGAGERAEQTAPWRAVLACWVAAAAGARACLLATAGQALPESDAPPPAGSLFLASDHLNLSGASPLVGLGPSELGPLFPDLTRLHHPGLRRSAAAAARARGVPIAEGVLACLAGPALATPAEARFLARAGAQAAVHELAAPLHACAHAGLAALSITALLDDGAGPADVARQAALAERLAPRLDALWLDLGPAVRDLAAEHAEEGGVR